MELVDAGILHEDDFEEATAVSFNPVNSWISWLD